MKVNLFDKNSQLVYSPLTMHLITVLAVLLMPLSGFPQSVSTVPSPTFPAVKANAKNKDVPRPLVPDPTGLFKETSLPVPTLGVQNPESLNDVMLGSGTSGGGGMISVDGETKIADPYVRPINTTARYRPHSSMKNRLKELIDLYQFYSEEARSDLSLVFGDLVIGSGFDVFYTKQLPCESELIEVPNTEMISYGCTQDGVTYLLEKEFNSLSEEDQALALIHERLHAFRPNAKHFHISDIVSGLKVALKALRQQENEDFTALSEAELEIIGLMRSAFVKNNILDSSLYRSSALTAHGGLSINWDRLSDISTSAVIGVLSRVRDSTIKNNAILMKATVNDSTIGEGVYVRGSTVNESNLGVNSRVDNSTLKISRLEVESSLLNSKIHNVILRPRSSVINSGIVVNHHEYVQKFLVVETDVVLKNATIEFWHGGRKRLFINPNSGFLDLENKKCIVIDIKYADFLSKTVATESESSDFIDSWCG